MIESNHVVLWNRCLEVIKDNVPETTYNTWFAPIVPLKYEDKTLIVQIPSQFFYEILEEKFVDLLRKTLYKAIGEGTKLIVSSVYLAGPGPFLYHLYDDRGLDVLG